MGNMVSWISLLAYSPCFAYCCVIIPSLICRITHSLIFIFLFLKTKYETLKTESHFFFVIVLPFAMHPDPPETGKSFIMITTVNFCGVGIGVSVLVLVLFVLLLSSFSQPTRET